MHINTSPRLQSRSVNACLFVILISAFYIFLVSYVRNSYVPTQEMEVYYLGYQQRRFNRAVAHIRSHHLIRHDRSVLANYSGYEKGKLNRTLSRIVARRLNYKRKGFFIECGASEGVLNSNTILLERKYGWTGLLIEADPVPLAILKKRNRRAWVADVCLSPQKQPQKYIMHGRNDTMGHGFIKNKVIEKELDTKALNRTSFEVQCYPLGMLMTALNRNKADYFSLDVEGMELEILKTIEFDKIHIKLISVAVRPNNEKEIQEFIESVGYKKVQDIPDEGLHEHLYERPDVKMAKRRRNRFAKPAKPYKVVSI